jgi:outer membrane biosynthesis protein TonB
MRKAAFPSCALFAVALGALLATTTPLQAGPHAFVAQDIVVIDTPVPIDTGPPPPPPPPPPPTPVPTPEPTPTAQPTSTATEAPAPQQTAAEPGNLLL